ncbi:MAG: DUF3098 domain-containing protein [Bacteroidota bacterium]
MAQKYTKPSTPAAKSTADNEQVNFIYDKSNYTLIAVSVLIVAIGFVIMAGNTDIYSTAKIVIAPLVVLAGFGLGFYALLKKPSIKS